MLRKTLIVVTVLYLAAVLSATLTPAGFPTWVFNGLFRGGGSVALPASTPRVDDVDFVANVLMFAPVGLLLALSLRRPLVAQGAAVLLTVAIEVVQLGIPSRISDLGDVLLNSGGALVGVVVGWIVLRLTSGSAGTRRYRVARAASDPAGP